MRDFTPEEKELIINTPILMDCFEMNGFRNVNPFEVFDRNGEDSAYTWEWFLTYLEELRLAYLETKKERFFIELVRLLPKSYKVVKL
jgi:hypothetical protein